MPAIRILSLFAAILCAAAHADEVEPSSAKADQRKMIGEYHVIHYERDGQPSPAATLKMMKVVLDKEGNGTFQWGGTSARSKIALNPKKKPKEVDSLYLDGPAKGQTIKGIYKLDAQGMTCCYGDVGQPRPTELKAGANSGRTLYSLKKMGK